MIFRLLVAAVITIAGTMGIPTEYFESEQRSISSGSPSQSIYFTQTGQYLQGEFLTYWSENGGVAVLGFPVSREIEQDGVTVQYFERAVLESVPESSSTPRVQLRLLGVNASLPEYRQGSAFTTSGDESNSNYFPETGHNLSSKFEKYWHRHGGVRVFGFPISSEFERDGVVIQYFERAILEYHENNPPEWRILQPLLGYQAALDDGIDTSPQPFDGHSIVYEPGLLGQGGAGVDDNAVYLTFDDGPHPEWTPQILDILDEYQATATFFVLGEQAAAHPDLIAEILAEGHVVANHSYDHRSMVGMTAEEFERQIRLAEDAVGEDMVRCMRPPYGAMDSNTVSYSEALGYEVVLWDVDPRDWEQPGAETIAERLATGVAPGDVVLLHDGGGHRAQSVEALELAMEQFSSAGYRFSPLECE